MIKIAVCQYQIELLSTWSNYVTKIESLVAQAKQQGVQVLLLPEYAGTEIACAQYRSDPELYQALQSLIPQYLDFYKSLASRHQLYIVSGTILEETAPARYVNRAYFFGPKGERGFQDKLQLTEYEKQTKVIQHGLSQNLFQTPFGTIGIAICYDSEFPEIVRGLVQAGASLILVPSYTSSLAGYHRVFLSCRARAIENQCYVAVSYVVGTAVLSGDPEETYGHAVVLGPADNGFPDDGIIAQSQSAINQAALLTTDIEFDKISLVRKQGQVHNFSDIQLCEEIRKRKINILSL